MITRKLIPLILLGGVLCMGATKSCGPSTNGLSGSVHRVAGQMVADYGYDGSHGKGNAVGDIQWKPIGPGPDSGKWIDENPGSSTAAKSDGEPVTGRTSAVQHKGYWRVKVTLYNSSGEQIGEPFYSHPYKQPWTWYEVKNP